MIKSKIYPNGLKLVVETKPEPDYATCLFTFNTGSHNERPNEKGVAHFVEHMMFKSNNKMSEIEITELFADLGAEYNAQTDEFSTGYYFNCLSEYFEKCFETFSDMLGGENFIQEELEKERSAVIEEINNLQLDDNFALYKELFDIHYAHCDINFDIASTVENVKKINIETLKKYINREYTLGNLIVSVAGNKTFEEVEKLVNNYLLDNIKKHETMVNSTGFLLNKKSEANFVLFPGEKEQDSVTIMFYAPVDKNDKASKVAQLYAMIMGNDMSSRLQYELRTKCGLVYNVSCGYDPAYGNTCIEFNCSNSNLAIILKKIRNVINEVADEGVTEKELRKAKALLETAFVMGHESNIDIASDNADCMRLFGRPVLTEDYMKECEDISCEDIKEYALSVAKDKAYSMCLTGKKINKQNILYFDADYNGEPIKIKNNGTKTIFKRKEKNEGRDNQ